MIKLSKHTHKHTYRRTQRSLPGNTEHW